MVMVAGTNDDGAHTHHSADRRLRRRQRLLDIGKRDLRRAIGHDCVHSIDDIARNMRILDLHHTSEMSRYVDRTGRRSAKTGRAALPSDRPSASATASAWFCHRSRLSRHPKSPPTDFRLNGGGALAIEGMSFMPGMFIADSGTERAAEDGLMWSTSSTSAAVTPLISCVPAAAVAGPAWIRAVFSGPFTSRKAMLPFSILEIA